MVNYIKNVSYIRLKVKEIIFSSRNREKAEREIRRERQRKKRG